MPSVEVPEDVESLLKDLEKRTGKPKSFYLREAVLAYIEELKDIEIAEQRYEDLLAGRSHTVPLEEVIRGYGMDFIADTFTMNER